MPKIAEIEDTPNPNAKKFILKEPLTYGLTRSFENAAEAASDPLAAAIFAIPHVTNVFYVDKWLSVTQDGTAPWPELLKQLAVPIRAAPAAAELDYAAPVSESFANLGIADNLRLMQINALLDEQIRPSLKNDGGDILVVGLEGNQLKVHYQGACGSCPTSLSGTLAGIENLVRTIEPDIELVPV